MVVVVVVVGGGGGGGGCCPLMLNHLFREIISTILKP